MTIPIDIAELRALLAEATPGPWLRPRTVYLRDRTLIVAAINSLGPLLDELETLRAEREADEKFEDDMTDIAKMSDAECDAALKTAGFSQERIEQGLRDALSIVRMAKDVAAANGARDAALARVKEMEAERENVIQALGVQGSALGRALVPLDEAMASIAELEAEAAKLRAALKEVVRSYDSVTRPDWVRNEAPWVTQARAALGKEKP